MTSPCKTHIILSLTDVASAIQSKRRWVWLAACLFALLGVCYQLLHPLQFSAEGVFQGQSDPKNNPLFKALQTVEKVDDPFSFESPRAFLRSYPVLEKVVHRLSLQGTLKEEVRGGPLRSMWEKVKVNFAHQSFAYNEFQKTRLHPLKTPTRLVIADQKPALCCEDLYFLGEVAQKLKIRFHDEHRFEVFKKREKVGNGSVGHPFVWEGGTFTLVGKGKKRVVRTLFLIPMDLAVAVLGKNISLKKDKDNPSLTHICFKHPNRHLAAAVVNEVMGQYQTYLKEESRKKIEQQIAYLRHRQRETVEQFESVCEQNRALLEERVEGQAIILLEREAEWMAEEQAKKTQSLLEIDAELTLLSRLLWPEENLSLAVCKNRLREAMPASRGEALTVESARNLIEQHQLKYDAASFDTARYLNTLVRLHDPHFDLSSLTNLLKDPSLQARLEKILAVERKLVDADNWSEKERAQLVGELDVERAFLKKYVADLKEGAELQQSLLQQKIYELQQNLGQLLLLRQEQMEQALSILKSSAASFPSRWLAEQKIQMSKKLSVEMMVSITKMIEAHIGHHLDYSTASPLQWASSPVIPLNPHLIGGGCVGFLGGAFLAACVIIFQVAFRGPSASKETLKSEGRLFYSGKERAPRLGLKLIQKKGILLFASASPTLFFYELMDWLEKRGDRCFLIPATANPLIENSPPSKTESERMAHLAGASFQNYLAQLQKSYDYVVLLYQGEVESYLFEALLAHSSRLVFGISDESLEQMVALPQNTLFFSVEKEDTTSSLAQLQPLVEKMITHSTDFSLPSSGWDASESSP